jgi:hypothetical protein
VNINKLKPYKYLGKTLRRLEAMIKREREHKEDSENKEDLEHKEDSQKGFHYGSTKNQTTSKNIFVNGIHYKFPLATEKVTY